ncbi:hypothetical protein JNK13_05865 [bacterium]|nr:hypothetical protein [bacterium]
MRSLFLTLTILLVLGLACDKGFAQESAQKQGRAISVLLEELKAEDLAMRIRAGMEIKANFTLQDLEAISSFLKKGGLFPDSEKVLIDVLGRSRSRLAVDTLRFAYDHGALPIKIAVTESYGYLAHASVIPLLTQIIRNQSTPLELRKRATSALGRIGTPEAIYALQTSFKGLDQTAISVANWAMRWAKNEINIEKVDSNFAESRKLELYYKGLKYYLYYPGLKRVGGAWPKLLVYIHDYQLQAESDFDALLPLAQLLHLTLLVPAYDVVQFPEYDQFNLQGRRSDLILLELIDYLATNLKIQSREVYWFGREQGGEFVERMALAHPERIARAVFESQSAIIPISKELFPNGAGDNPLSPDLKVSLEKFLKTEITHLVSNADDRVTPENYSELWRVVSSLGNSLQILPRIGVRSGTIGSNENGNQVLGALLFGRPGSCLYDIPDELGDSRRTKR